MTTVGELIFKMSADLATLKTDMAGARATVKSATDGIQSMIATTKAAFAALGVGLSIGAFKSFIEGGIEAEAQLHRLNLQTGLSVDMLSALRPVAKAGGSDLDTLAGMVNKLEKNMLAFAQTGSGKTADAFRQLHFSREQVQAGLQNMDTFLPEFAKRLIETGVGGERAGLAMQLMARGGAAALPVLDELARKTKLVGTETDAQAKAAHEFEVSLSKLKEQSTLLSISLANELLPSMTKIIDKYLELKAVGGIWSVIFGFADLKDGTDSIERLQEKLNDITKTRDALKGMPLVGRLWHADDINLANLQIALMTKRLADLQAVQSREIANLPPVTVPPEERKPLGDTQADAQSRYLIQAAALKGVLELQKDMIARGQSIEKEAYAKNLIGDLQFYEDRQRLITSNLDAELAFVKDAIALEQKAFKSLSDPKEIAAHKVKIEVLTNSGIKAEQDAAAQLAILTMEKDAKVRERLIEVYKIEGASALQLFNVQAQVNKIQTDAFTVAKDYANELEYQTSLIGRSAIEQQKMNEAHRIDLDLIKQLRDAATEAGDNMAQFDAARAALISAAEQQKKIVLDSVTYRIKKEREWVTGAREAFNDYIDAASNAALQAKNFISNSFRGMEDAIVSFVRTGKLDFRSFADSIISDMIRINVQRSVTGPLAGFLGKTVETLVGGFFGTQSPAPVQEGPTPRAGGGPVESGNAFLIGERGPEVFVPGSSGSIIPNDALVGGGTTINVYPDLRGASAETVLALHQMIVNLNASIESRAVTAVAQQRMRGGSFASVFS